MADPKHLGILGQGITNWNRWRLENIDPDLSGSNLRNQDFSGFDFHNVNFFGARLAHSQFRECDLRNADLREANLEFANFNEAVMDHAKLDDASLAFATLSGASLRMVSAIKCTLAGARLSHAKLYGANFSQTDALYAEFFSAKLERANFTGAQLGSAHFYYADLSNADLAEANLSNANLVNTNLQSANLTGCKVYGASVWDVNLIGAKQNNLVITDRDPHISVDDLEIAQFVYLMLNHKNIRKAIDAITKNGVLLLGRFADGGLKLLQAVASHLRLLGYLPIIFDFEKPKARNYTETIKILVGLSRFVIADLSGPSVPQELYSTIPHFKIPFVPIKTKHSIPYALFSDLLEHNHVLKPPIEFESEIDLIQMLSSKVVAPAEEMLRERQILLDKLFDSSNYEE